MGMPSNSKLVGRLMNKNNNITVIAIGGFDGMHIGHQHLFSALGEDGCIVVIETGYANLTPKRERENFSHHPIIYLDLDDIRHLDGEEFISFLILVKTVNITLMI
jgi:riboflavin kinase/FMN adenylyltransferase